MKLTNREYVLSVMKNYGKLKAKKVQEDSPKLSGEQLYDEEGFIPTFTNACNNKNMLDREIGFVCVSSSGRVVKLLQKYDSTIYTQEPEELPSLWGFVWSKNPKHALPFISISTSPYNLDEVCSLNDKIYKSTIPNNVWSPTDYPQGWEEVQN